MSSAEAQIPTLCKRFIKTPGKTLIRYSFVLVLFSVRLKTCFFLRSFGLFCTLADLQRSFFAFICARLRVSCSAQISTLKFSFLPGLVDMNSPNRSVWPVMVLGAMVHGPETSKFSKKILFREEHSMDQYRSRPKLSENFEDHWSIPILGEIHMDQSLVHTFSWGNSYGPMVLKVLQKFPPTLVLVHGWLFPVSSRKKAQKTDLADSRSGGSNWWLGAWEPTKCHQSFL